MSERRRFQSVIEQARGPGATVARIPDEHIEALGGFHQKRAVGTVNGVPFSTPTFPYRGEGLWVGVPKQIREAAGAKLGDNVEIELELDERPREIVLPPELEAAFDQEPALRERFEALSWSRKRLIFEPLAEAKRPETRAARLAKAMADLGA